MTSAAYPRRIAAEATHCHKLGLRLPGSAVSTAPREMQEAAQRKPRSCKLKRRNINNKRPVMDCQKPTGDRTADRKHSFKQLLSHCNIGQGVVAEAIGHLACSFSSSSISKCDRKLVQLIWPLQPPLYTLNSQVHFCVSTFECSIPDLITE